MRPLVASMIAPTGSCVGPVSSMNFLLGGTRKKILPLRTLTLTDLPTTGGGSCSIVAAVGEGPDGGGGAGVIVPGGAGAASSQRTSIGRVSPGAMLSSANSTPTPLSGAA